MTQLQKIILAATCCLAILIVAGFFFRTSIARSIWNTSGLPSLALVLDESDATLAFAIGDYYYGGGTYDPTKAEAAYRKAVAIDPALPLAHYQLARVLFVENKPRLAHDAVRTELRVNPGNFRAWYMQGLIEAYAGHISEAEQSFSKFVSAAPQEWAGYNDLAWVLGLESKYQDAEQLLEQALQRVPDGTHNPWLLNNLGVQQLNLRQYAAAAISFTQASDLASALTEDMWHRAYPGNNPSASADGLAQFRAAIQQNLKEAHSKGTQ